MAKRIAQWLRDLALWLDPPPPPPPPPPPAPPDPARVKAAQLIREAEGFAAGTSGEYKRHWVYAALLRDFPERRKRDLALLIEETLQDVL